MRTIHHWKTRDTSARSARLRCDRPAPDQKRPEQQVRRAAGYPTRSRRRVRRIYIRPSPIWHPRSRQLSIGETRRRHLLDAYSGLQQILRQRKPKCEGGRRARQRRRGLYAVASLAGEPEEPFGLV